MHLDSGVDCIGAYVHQDRCLWVIDWMEYFHQDATSQVHEFDNYRSGISVLNEQTFERYLALEQPYLLGHNVLHELLFRETPAQELTALVIRLTEADHDWNQFSQREVGIMRKAAKALPLFYTNFDRKVFYHYHFDRPHEDYISDGWIGEFKNFFPLLPVEERWWLIDGIDYSALRGQCA